MKTLLLTLLSVSTLHAVEPAFDWVFAGGGEKNDKTRGVTTDREGNVFLACESTGDGRFGELQRTSAGGMDFCLIKLDPAGKPLWVRSIGGSKTDRGYGVATDAKGNAFVTGHYESADAVADGVKLSYAGEYDAFIAKYDRDGKLLWVRSAGGPGYDYGHGIAVDPKGDIVVAGAIGMKAVFDGTALNNGGRAVFCAKYDNDGKLLWVRVTSDKLTGSAHGVGVDGVGQIYVGGLVSGEGTFGSAAINAPTQAAFAAKLSPIGEVQWTSIIPGTPSALYHEITCDAEGRVWAAGMFKGSVTIAGETFRSTGDKDNDGFVVHIDQAGKAKWARHLSSKGTDYCLGVAADGHGTCFVTGEFSETASFAGKTLTTRGSTDIVTACFDQAGSLQWLLQSGGSKGDNAYTMAHHASGHLVIAGACAAPASFGTRQLKQSGGADLYAAKLNLK